jgi:hypothetical protein
LLLMPAQLKNANHGVHIVQIDSAIL